MPTYFLTINTRQLVGEVGHMQKKKKLLDPY